MAPGGDDANATGRGRGLKRSRRGVNRLTLRACLEIGALQRTPSVQRNTGRRCVRDGSAPGGAAVSQQRRGEQHPTQGQPGRTVVGGCLAIQVFGSYGYSGEYGIERYFRNARAPIIYEGTTQIHKMMQAEHALGYRNLNGREGEISPLAAWGPALAGVFASFLAGTEIPDLNSGLRLMRKDLVQRYEHEEGKYVPFHLEEELGDLRTGLGAL